MDLHQLLLLCLFSAHHAIRCASPGVYVDLPSTLRPRTDDRASTDKHHPIDGLPIMGPACTGVLF